MNTNEEVKEQVRKLVEFMFEKWRGKMGRFTEDRSNDILANRVKVTHMFVRIKEDVEKRIKRDK